MPMKPDSTSTSKVAPSDLNNLALIPNSSHFDKEPQNFCQGNFRDHQFIKSDDYLTTYENIESPSYGNFNFEIISLILKVFLSTRSNKF